MNRPWLFLIYFATLLAARGADLGSTYYFSPDLAREGNPVAVSLGSWPSILVVQAVAFVVIAGLLAVYCYGRTHRASREGLKKVEYAADCLLGDPSRTRAVWSTFLFLWPLPKNWLQYGRLLGFVLVNAVIVVSFLAAFCWWMLWGWKVEWFNTFYGSASIAGYPGGLVYLFGIFVSIAAALFVFYGTELHRQRQSALVDGGDT
ncbi:MAG: hypothetical protein AAGJ79_07510 [Verrucomicrobiota bacterium]